MDDLERQALTKLQLDWAPTPEDVWMPTTAHVKGLNDNVLRAVMAAFVQAETSQGPSPTGVVITGQQGTGKTHSLGVVRAEVQRRGGYFFLLGLLHGQNFWQNVVHAIRTGLYRPGLNGERQLAIMLRRLADRLGLSGEIRSQVVGESALTRQALDQVVLALCDTDRLGHECRHAARAMILLAAHDLTAREVGESYLTSASEAVPGERIEWGIHPDPKPAHQIVGQVSRLLALTGPSVLAIDQIDTLIAQSGRSTDAHALSPIGLPREQLLEQIGTGLMDLRDATHRMVTVVACQYQAWEGISSLPSVGRRFREAPRLHNVPSEAVGRALVEARFAPRFAEVVGFRPQPSTWPVWPEAFAEADRFTPGQLFKRIDDHIRSCLDAGTVVPLTSLDGGSDRQPRRQPPGEPVSEEQLYALDNRFDDLLRQVDPSAALDKATEDVRMPALLDAGLRAYIEEQGDQREQYSLDPPPGDNPALHAKLLRTLDEEAEDALHWSFRAIVGPHYRTVQNRIDRLQVTAGLDRDAPKRKAYLLRTGNWATGTKVTREKLKEFRAAGGVVFERVEIQDLRTFAALERILEPMGGKPTPEVSVWLRHRRHAGQTALFRAVFGEPGTGPEPGIGADSRPPPPAGISATARSHNSTVSAPPPEQLNLFGGMEGPQWPNDDPDTAGSQAAVDPPHLISLGRRVDTGAAVPVQLESLRKHIAIFAGSGSGKTVLIRRLIEECALRGVSSIVLDPNNDLARLGDAWPQPPGSWDNSDATRAADYLTHTDVVIWTPRREMGRPLSFQPLPDLAAVVDDPDEFGLALDTAVATLAPRARADGSTAKAERARAVLRTALASFAREGGSGLTDFLELLAHLPDGVTTLTNARAMAEDMSQTLKAAVINDPLFGGSGALADPGTLLTPTADKRARVSVVSLIGLPTDQQRQSFVNQLQMALFAWIKQHPAGDRPLGGLFVMDEAQTLAPSGGMTACTASTLALASQARKYGLGLIFATQSPKGIHNRIIGNAATQYFGFLNSPVQVAAAKEMAAAKSSAVLDISRLSVGQFYAVGEGMPFQKVKTPMCLSHHPPSPLTVEEVLARAREAPDWIR